MAVADVLLRRAPGVDAGRSRQPPRPGRRAGERVLYPGRAERERAGVSSPRPATALLTPAAGRPPARPRPGGPSRAAAARARPPRGRSAGGRRPPPRNQAAGDAPGLTRSWNRAAWGLLPQRRGEPRPVARRGRRRAGRAQAEGQRPAVEPAAVPLVVVPDLQRPGAVGVLAGQGGERLVRAVGAGERRGAGGDRRAGGVVERRVEEVVAAAAVAVEQDDSRPVGGDEGDPQVADVGVVEVQVHRRRPGSSRTAPTR